jgi:uncharacterized protein YodC (DUF2158 family)
MEKGQKVILKSGSPIMIIEDIIGDKATCIWYRDEEKKVETLPLLTLVKVEG